MVKSLSDRQLHSYALLWGHYKTKEFSLEEAMNILTLQRNHTYLILSELCKRGWATSKRRYHGKDADHRYKNYVLVDCQSVLSTISSPKAEK